MSCDQDLWEGKATGKGLSEKSAAWGKTSSVAIGALIESEQTHG